MAERATYVCRAACDNLDHHPACDGRGADCVVTASRTDRQPPNTPTNANGGQGPVTPS